MFIISHSGVGTGFAWFSGTHKLKTFVNMYIKETYYGFILCTCYIHTYIYFLDSDSLDLLESRKRKFITRFCLDKSCQKSYNKSSEYVSYEAAM